ncbi:MAG TPA: Arc family DNA-binding protein [Gammaproteobacteria bacterium]|nr:Arc family DNA-binding protein [Gammaproteobacteria bacterium]
MATLNVKQFPDDLYNQLRERAENEHRSIAQEVVHLLDRTLREPDKRSILELQGLGKALWEDEDASRFVDSERASWD